MTQYTGDVTNSLMQVDEVYAEGIEPLVRACPSCGENVTYDFSEEYLFCGDLAEIRLYCDDCNIEWTLEAKVISSTITIEVAE